MTVPTRVVYRTFTTRPTGSDPRAARGRLRPVSPQMKTKQQHCPARGERSEGGGCCRVTDTSRLYFCKVNYLRITEVTIVLITLHVYLTDATF